MIGEYPRSEVGYGTRSILAMGESGPIRWNRNPLTSSQKELVGARYFSSLDIKPADAPLVSQKSQTHETRRVSVHRGLRYLTRPLRRVHWRGFHAGRVSLDKSNSDKSNSTGCKRLDVICKAEEPGDCGKPCKKKDRCRLERVKCVKPPPKKDAPKAPKCKDTCLPVSKCDLPKTEVPLKMSYKKLTCPPSKFAKLASCPPVQEDVKRDKQSMEASALKKKIVCVPPPLPKPPCGPIRLCPCPPPMKIHPGMCPCYKYKAEIKSLTLPPCSPKKPYPCPKQVHYCPPKKCKRRPPCEENKQPKTPKL